MSDGCAAAAGEGALVPGRRERRARAGGGEQECGDGLRGGQRAEWKAGRGPTHLEEAHRLETLLLRIPPSLSRLSP